ncbi:GSCOCG00007985001-RA-CDS [Cotesia congregata]|nr:GSCOCG00007985001-RA-CDS [Cotesia congregata]
MPVKNQNEIYKHMESDAIRDFRLVNLPTLSDKLIKLPSTKQQLQELEPGCTLNIRELKGDTVSVITIMRFLLFEKIFSESDENFAMTIRTYNNDEKIKSSCPYQRLAFQSNDHINDHQNLEFFDCLVEHKQFGIPGYLTKEFKRMEVRVCRTVKKESAEEPLTIINWHKDFEDIGYNVFIRENIIIKYPKEGETHYVSSVYKGDCLYQAFVYNANDNIDKSLPLFTSELISGSGNVEFINKVTELLLNTETPKRSLYQVLENETLKSEVKKQFGDNYLLSVNLRPMHTKRPLPQLNLIEYSFNFGNSLQASLLTIFVAMIAAKLLIN